MKNEMEKIQQTLAQQYGLDMGLAEVNDVMQSIRNAQQCFPAHEQQSLMIRLLKAWEERQDKKIITVISEANCPAEGPFVTTFGILSVDWPGLFDICVGIIHEMGWNIDFTKGLSMKYNEMDLGIIIIGVRTESQEDHHHIIEQGETITQKFHQAAIGIGTQAKTYLIIEEIRKLEIYSQVITYIQQVYHGDDLDAIIGKNGEAVKFFAARSRDYIENRSIEDIAWQIIRNFTFIKMVQTTGKTIQLHISNFKTQKEGTFTGVTVAGPAHMLHLEDCLKTIEHTSPDFKLKHNREFTTQDGVSLFRIEFVDSTDHALNSFEQTRLKKAFSTMVLNKRQDRARWIEAMGGKEHFARAIIPLLVKETQSTGQAQVYHSVSGTTDLTIDFKIIVVVPMPIENPKRLVTKTINQLETVTPFHILAVKPAKTFGKTVVFIIDLRVSLTEVENTETIYKMIKQNICTALGEFRDFDEGMRTIDTMKLKTISAKFENENKNLIRELYYSMEDFYRISAPNDEIIAHIRIALDMLDEMDQHEGPMYFINRLTGTQTKSGSLRSTASLFCMAYPHEYHCINDILDILEAYDVTLSRLEKRGKDILICRITQNNKPLPGKEHEELTQRFKMSCKAKLDDINLKAKEEL